MKPEDLLPKAGELVHELERKVTHKGKTVAERRAGAKKHMEFMFDWGKSHIGYVYGGGEAQQGYDAVKMAEFFHRGGTWSPDCKTTCDWIMEWSGFNDLYGWELNSTGWYDKLPKVERAADLKTGGLITFGPWDHVIMVYEPGPNPTCMSHGYSRSGNKMLLSVEMQAHKGQAINYLNVGELLKVQH
jgi:hypothetical protein